MQLCCSNSQRISHVTPLATVEISERFTAKIIADVAPTATREVVKFFHRNLLHQLYVFDDKHRMVENENSK